MQVYFKCTHLYISAPPPVLLFVPFNPLKMFQFCPCYVPMETPRKSLNFSHAALVGHELSRAKPDPRSQQAGSQKNHPIFKLRFDQESANISILTKIFPSQFDLGLVQAAPLPTLVGWVACCQLDLDAGCGTPQGHPQGPAPLAGLLRAL